MTFAAIGRGVLSATAAIEAGRLSVEGDPAAAERCASLFRVGDAAEAATA
ncbi:MAG TPA: hypothetical protein VH817_14085 [Thermoleophilaceae bacterium]|jgi:hypothetical protein